MLDTSKIYTSNNNGEFKVIKVSGYNNVKVVFVKTMYTTTTRTSHVLSGSIKDPLYPSVFGVGFIGDGQIKASIKGSHTDAYRHWQLMLGRCYSKEYLDRFPTYTGCSVCDDWHDFQIFAAWHKLNYIEGYHLDKDILVDGNKVYSPEFCLYVTQKENAIKAQAKWYKFKNPKGVEVDIFNMAEFCRNNGLNNKLMSLVSMGKRSHHKGWRSIGLSLDYRK